MLKVVELIFLTLSTIAYSSGAVWTHAQQNRPPQLIRIHSKGGTTLDSDILLPYSIIQNIQHQGGQQQHWIKHKSQPFNTKVRALTANRRRILVAQYPLRKPYYRRQSRTFLSAASASSQLSSKNQIAGKGKLHFEKDNLHGKMFKLYDDDGEHLFNLGELLKTPLITNVTTSWIKGKSAKSPQKMVKHIWINL